MTIVSSADAELVQLVQQHADVPVVVDHRVVVRRLPSPGLPAALRLGVRSKMHVGGVEPDKERRFGLVLAVDEVDGGLQELVVDGLHPLLGQWAGVLDATVGVAVDHSARAEALAEVGEVLSRRVVGQLRLLLGVQVVQVAEELVEAVVAGQELVLVAKMVLAELAGRVPQRLEQLGDRRVLGLQPHVGAGQPDLAQPGPEHALAGDEGGPPCRAALLPVVVGEPHPLGSDTVDVRRSIAHQPVAVAAQVADSDVVTPHDQDVRPVAIAHQGPPIMERSSGSADSVAASVAWTRTRLIKCRRRTPARSSSSSAVLRLDPRPFP